MSFELPVQLQQIQKELDRNLAEAERIGESLITLGRRLRDEPWKWSIDWLDDSLPGAEGTNLVEPDVADALSRVKIEWLLENIRILRRREADLRSLAVI
jgi:hypothetical protein